MRDRIADARVANSRRSPRCTRAAQGSGANSDHGTNNQAALSASTAEADLATGVVDRGLAEYRRAAEQAGDLAGELPADPFEFMVVSAVVDAHVLAGRSELVADLALRLGAVAMQRLGPADTRIYRRPGRSRALSVASTSRPAAPSNAGCGCLRSQRKSKHARTIRR